MLEVDIRKKLGAFELRVEARSSARIVGVVGPSGAGKTTLLDCIAGLIAPDQGRIAIDGRVLDDSCEKRRAVPPRRRKTGYVFQDGLVFPHLTVEANLRYSLGTHGPAPPFEDVADVLELRTVLDRPGRALSGGEARRVALGRALLSGPQILLLDEPLAGLDGALTHRTLSYLHRLLSTFPVRALYVSHTISEVAFLCQDIWVLDGGRVVTMGSPRQVLATPNGIPSEELASLENMFMAVAKGSAGKEFVEYQVGDQRIIARSPRSLATHEVLLTVHASEIILARKRPEQISARNILPGHVTSVAPFEELTLVFVDVGVEWMALLTPGAVAELRLEPGVEVFAIVKASSVFTDEV